MTPAAIAYRKLRSATHLALVAMFAFPAIVLLPKLIVGGF